MNAIMAEPTKSADDAKEPGRVRMIVDTKDAVRRAVKLRALKQSRPGHEVSYSDVVNAILLGEQPPLAREVEEVSGYGEADTGRKPRPKPKP